MSDWEPPPLFDEYQVLRAIGRGGMGHVYLAHDLLLDRPVAVKFISGLEPDARRTERFRLEGRAVARLAHPNVVAVHRVGEVDGRPYLVSEYIRGRSLEAVEKPLPWLQVLPLALGMARGLAAAHRRGVLHRDIKPGNVMVATDGTVKLVDFGLAKFVEVGPPPAGGETLSQALEPGDPPMDGFHTLGDRLGTPLYMAPETLRSEPATRRSDLYSLGAVLFELVTGRPQRSGGRVYHTPATPLRQLAPTTDARFAEAVDRCLSEDPALRFGTAEELLEALEPLSPEGRRAVVPKGNPYRGLRPFDAEHRDLFFGRDADVREVLERLRAEPLVIVTGDSGVGKSSLCRAGVLPRAEDGELGGPIRVYRLAPGRTPLRALASALSVSLETPPEALEAWIRSDPDALARALRQHQAGRQTAIQLVFVDQLEELFTLAPPPDAQLFAEVLAGLTTAPATHVLATVRGDFFTRLASLGRLGEEVARALHLLRPLSQERMRETITGPARLKGVSFESEALVDELLGSAGRSPGGLPLLQFALAELWDGRDLARAVVPAALLARIGGVEGALARHADEVLARLLPPQREAARRLLLRLVTAEGTRSQGGAAELGATGPEGVAALEALVQGRLLVAQELDGATAYQLAHEALLRDWGTLRTWLEEDGDRSAVRGRLEAAAAEWQRLGSRPEELWRARQLEEAAGVEELGLSDTGRDFLQRSRDAARRARRARLATLAAVPVLLVTVLGGAWLKARLDLQGQVADLLSASDRAMARGEALAKGLEAKRRAAFALYDAEAAAPAGAPSTWAEAQALWSEALAETAQTEAAYREATQPLETAVSVAPGWPEPRRKLVAVVAKRWRLAAQAHRREQAEDLLTRLAGLDPSGEALGGLSSRGAVTVKGLPPGATATFQRLDGAGAPGHPEVVAAVAGRAELSPGSYLGVFLPQSGAPLRYPLLLRPGAAVELELEERSWEAPPSGFTRIERGPFLCGSGDPEEVREGLDAPPMHEVVLPSYLIGTTEETIGRYLAFLESLPPAERSARAPRNDNEIGALAVTPDGKGHWRFSFRAAEVTLQAGWGEPVRFPGRQDHASQDWRLFPVAAVSANDALAYAAWLSATGRVPGARLCTELEWEKAARGADGRTFVTGERLDKRDANLDITHGGGNASGPEEVASRPGDTSVLGVRDLTGNVLEMVSSVQRTEAYVVRGGAWGYDRWLSRVTNRSALQPGTRSATMGIRLCADPVGGAAPEGRPR